MNRLRWSHDLEGLIEMAKEVDDAGLYSVLLTYGSTGTDYMMLLPDLIKETKNIKFMMALRPYSLTPEYAAKMFKTIKLNYGDRVALNLVAGKFSGDWEENFTLKNFPYDSSLINSVDKRIQLTDLWAEKFFYIMRGGFENVIDLKFENWPETYTISNSPLTVNLGNKHADYLICEMHTLDSALSLIKDKKIVLIIDPLIRETEEELSEEIEYVYNPINRTNKENIVGTIKNEHNIKGNMDSVIKQLKKISEQYGINDFMIVTNQKNLKPIFNLVKTLS